MKCFNFLTQTCYLLLLACYSWLIADSSLDVFPTNGVNLSSGTENVQLVAHIVWEGGEGGVTRKYFSVISICLSISVSPVVPTRIQTSGDGGGGGGREEWRNGGRATSEKIRSQRRHVLPLSHLTADK